MSNKYEDKDQKIKEKVTAHLANGCYDEVNINNDQFTSKNYHFVDYKLMASPTHQRDNIKKAYFNSQEKDQNIIFS